MKQRDRGYDEASYVESFLVLNAVGGDCLEDFDQLREDAGLAEMMGHELVRRAGEGRSVGNSQRHRLHDGSTPIVGS